MTGISGWPQGRELLLEYFAKPFGNPLKRGQ
jgi:hypothetical protein